MSSTHIIRLNKRKILLFIGWFLCFMPPLILRISNSLAPLIQYGGILYVAFLFVIFRPQKLLLSHKKCFFIVTFLMFIFWTITIVAIKSSSYLIPFIKADILPLIEVVILLCLSINSKSKVPREKLKDLNVLYYLMWTYLILDFLSIILFREGIIKSSIGSSIDRANWVLGSKNNQSIYLLLIVSFICLYSIEIGKKTYGLLGCLIALFCAMFTGSDGLQFMGGSSVGIITMLLMLAVYLFCGMKQIEIFNISYVYIYLLVCLIYFFVLNFNNTFIVRLATIVTSFFQKNITYSNRIYVWESVKKYIFDSPWFGYGEQQINFYFSATHTLSSETTYVYNLFLKILFSYGFVGFILFSGIIIQLPKVKDLQYSVLTASLICIFINGLMNEIRFHFLFLYPIIIMIVYDSTDGSFAIDRRIAYR